MKLKSFKIFESVDELKTILSEILTDLVDEFDPEFSLNDLANESVIFKFNFEYIGVGFAFEPSNSDVESIKKHVEQSQQKTDIYRKFITIMKKLNQLGYTTRITQKTLNSRVLIIELRTNVSTSIDWIQKSDHNAVVIDCEKLNIYLNKYSMKLLKVTETEKNDVSVVHISYEGVDHSEGLLGQDRVKIENEIRNTYLVDDVNLSGSYKKRGSWPSSKINSESIVLNIGYDLKIINEK